MNDFALSPFPRGDPAGCFVTLAGPREEISGYILVSKALPSSPTSNGSSTEFRCRDQRDLMPVGTAMCVATQYLLRRHSLSHLVRGI